MIRDDFCTACGAQSWRPLFEVDHFPIEKCRVCGLGRTKVDRRFPSFIEQKFYGDHYRKFYLDSRTKFLLMARYRRIIRQDWPYFSSVRNILDLGCSYGYFLEVAKEFGWDAVGLEPNASIYQYLRKRFSKSQVYNFTLERGRFRDEFDLVTYWDVLEHIGDPKRELALVHRALRKDGYLLVHCPNKGSLGALISGPKWGWWSPPDHLYHFTPESLRRLIERSGFRVVFLKTSNTEEEIVRGIFNLLSPKKIPRIAGWLNLLHDLTQRVLRPLLAPLLILEGRLGKAGLITILAQRRESSE